MAVRIRMKKLGRRHRPFFRVCAIDGRKPRDGKVIEELGYYDPMIRETDARAVLNGERIDYWISVGAQPSDNVRVLIKKYGSNGTHIEQQKEALERLKAGRVVAPAAPPPPKPEETEPETEEAEPVTEATEEPAAEASATEEAPPEAESSEEKSE